MTRADIKIWLSYWKHGKMVNVDSILAPEHVYEARRYCSCMNVGVFHNVSDGQIWDALREMRIEEAV